VDRHENNYPNINNITSSTPKQGQITTRLLSYINNKTNNNNNNNEKEEEIVDFPLRNTGGDFTKLKLSILSNINQNDQKFNGLKKDDFSTKMGKVNESDTNNINNINNNYSKTISKLNIKHQIGKFYNRAMKDQNISPISNNNSTTNSFISDKNNINNINKPKQIETKKMTMTEKQENNYQYNYQNRKK
jgi:hypothetical protein